MRIAGFERTTAPDRRALGQVTRGHRDGAMSKTEFLEDREGEIVCRTIARAEGQGLASHRLRETIARFADDFLLQLRAVIAEKFAIALIGRMNVQAHLVTLRFQFEKSFGMSLDVAGNHVESSPRSCLGKQFAEPSNRTLAQRRIADCMLGGF